MRNRQAWVAVKDLQMGERVASGQGTSRFLGKEQVEDRQVVYNLEVYRCHNFLVSTNRILVHNTCGDGWIAKDLYSKLGNKNPELRKIFEDALGKGAARAQGEAGIKRLSGKGQNVGGTLYQYELKTAPGSK